MGCNCKKTAKAAAKYTDEETIHKLSGFNKLLFIVRKIVTIVLVVLIFIIVIPFGIINGIIRIITGRSLKINVSKIIKLFHVRN